jgi:MFS family permease
MIDHNTAESSRLLTRNFLYLLLATFLSITSIGVFYLFPLFVLEWGGNKSDIGILMGVMSLSAVGVRPWASNLVDNWGRKRSFILGGAVLALVSLIHIFTAAPIDSIFYLLLLLRFVYGAGLGLIIVAAVTFATDLIPSPRLNHGLGVFGVMPLLGIAVGPMIGETVMASYGFTGMFLSAVLIVVVAVLLVLPVGDTFTGSSGPERHGFFTVLRYPAVWRMASIILCFGVAFAAHGGFVAPFAKTKGLTISTYFITYSATAVVSRLFGSKLTTKLGEFQILTASFLVIGAGFSWLIWVEGNTGLAVSGALAGAGHGLFFPTALACAVRSVSADDRGKVTGVITGSVDAGILVGSLLLGQVGELLGFSALFVTAASFVFAGALLFGLSRRTFQNLGVFR